MTAKTRKADLPKRATRAIGWTRAGMVAERITQCFWPLWSCVFAGLGAIMLGFPWTLPLEAAWVAIVSLGIAAIVSLYRGIRRFRWPSRIQAEEKLDATLPGRPIKTLQDHLAIGGGDDAAEAVWKAHRARMTDRAKTAKAVKPGLRVANADPYALRYVAVLVLAVGLLFGSILRVGQVGDLAPGSAQASLGPSWEGWVEPPRYTGLPTVYLPDVTDPEFEVPQGSNITLRLYGEVGALTVGENVSGRAASDVPAASDPVQNFDVEQPGTLAVNGDGGRVWDIAIRPDQPPTVEFSEGLAQRELADRTAMLEEGFSARDDYAVVAGKALFDLALENVDRRHGLTIAPEPRALLELPLPMTIAGDRSAFSEVLTEDLSKHPWANLPVSLNLEVIDELEQVGRSESKEMLLPGRRFFDPVAKAVIEQRRDLLWNRENAARIAQILRTITYDADGLFRQEVTKLRVEAVLRRIEALSERGMNDEQQAEIAEVLWDLAIQLEEGDLNDARERLERAQERLQEAIENGASNEEIAELMQELREAMQDYMQQLAESQPEGQQSQPQNPENMQEMTQQDLQDMLDEIQRLMEEGRMAEAEELLQQLQQMMENMQVTQGQQGQEGQQSEGQQAMEGLAETLREQQGLSDEAFRDLQEQFNPNAQQGDNSENRGRDGNQGQGQQHSEGQQGQQGRPSDQQGQQGGNQQGQQQQGNSQGGQQQGQQSPGDLREGLADRQQALRQQLEQQRNSMPGAGTPEGDAARDALDRAGRAMDNAEDALRRDELAEAIDDQSEAMDALREGMQNLADQMQQQAQQQPGQGQQNQQAGNANPQQRDPLGREPGSRGQLGSDEELLGGEDVYRRAEELLDEIRRRSAEAERPEAELDYLKRLLDRF
ncbi:MAG: TIGR02302 family protein [Pseudomonadota bacterium]